MGTVRIGISGWRYAPWRGVFYPDGLQQRRELEYASRSFPSVEINGSFYSLQDPGSYERWCRDTPAGFVFSVKGSRYITHMRRLREIEVRSPIFSLPGFSTCARSSGPSFGSSRRTSATIPKDSSGSSRCCRAIRPRPSRWRVAAMRG